MRRQCSVQTLATADRLANSSNGVATARSKLAAALLLKVKLFERLQKGRQIDGDFCAKSRCAQRAEEKVHGALRVNGARVFQEALLRRVQAANGDRDCCCARSIMTVFSSAQALSPHNDRRGNIDCCGFMYAKNSCSLWCSIFGSTQSASSKSSGQVATPASRGRTGDLEACHRWDAR